MNDFKTLLASARKVSWENFGKKIIFYVPGIFCYNGKRGKYSAISITGKDCALQCNHCKGKLLESMIEATTPEKFIDECMRLKAKGDLGCLISGGLQRDGTIPWAQFISAIKYVKESTKLFISIHCGMIDFPTALQLKGAGVDQALIDVIGDADTFKRVYNTDLDIERIIASMAALKLAGVPIIPHIVVGLDYGKINGEYKAIEIIKNFAPEVVVIVSLMPLPETPMADVQGPSPQDIAKIMATVRIEMPKIPVALGCARKRGDSQIDVWAVDCGINRIALPSEEAIAKAQEYSLEIAWQATCCSLPIL